MKDLNGYEITTDSSSLIDNINIFLQNMVSNGTQAIVIFDAAKEHPDNVLTQCYAGSLYLYGQRNVDTAITKQHLKTAEKHLKNSNERERLIFEAITAWSDLDFSLAIQIFMKILNDYPRDLLCAKYSEWLFYLLGQKYNAQAMLHMCETMAPHYNDDPNFYSTYSFALELSGKRVQAIDMANCAVDLKQATPWAHHTLAHGYLLLGEIQKGTQILEDLRHTWSDTIPSLRGHNNWHLGLMYIAEGLQEQAMKIYKEAIWGANPDTVLEQLDAISYLWRMEMAGLNPNESWQDIFSYIKDHAAQAYVPFNSMHFIYACARSNEHDMAKQIIKSAERIAKQSSGIAEFNWRMVGVPVIKATYAYAQGEYEQTVKLLQPILNVSPACGGSDAQIEIVEEMYCSALLKNKQTDDAQRFFNENLAFYKNAAVESAFTSL